MELSEWVEAAYASEVVVAAGGDGTVGAVVGHLRRCGLLPETVVGLLPLGTGNDLARAVGLPLEPEAAAATVIHGCPRPLDLLVDDAGRVAVNAVHAGIGGVAAAQAAPLKPFLGRMAYRLGALSAGVSARSWRLSVHVDRRPLFEGRALWFGIGNGATIGGGTALWPAARPDDGLLDVLVVQERHIISRVTMAAALRMGNPSRISGVSVAQGSSVRIEGDPIPENIDGEVGTREAVGNWRIEEGAWRLLAPPPG